MHVEQRGGGIERGNGLGMGVPKPDDPYGMTASPAWPEADEDALETLSQTFKNAASTLRVQSELAQHEQAMIFTGVALWSGGSASAANGVLGQRIAELQGLATRLQAAGDLLHNCSEAVRDAKKQIFSNVENANEDIAAVSSDKDIKDDEKKRYVQQKIQDVKNTNISLIQAEADSISGKQPAPDLSQFEIKRDHAKPSGGVPANNLVDGAIPGPPPSPGPGSNKVIDQPLETRPLVALASNVTETVPDVPPSPGANALTDNPVVPRPFEPLVHVLGQEAPIAPPLRGPHHVPSVAGAPPGMPGIPGVPGGSRLDSPHSPGIPPCVGSRHR